MLDKLPERLRESARGTARASQMIADDKSARNQAAGDVGACYEGLRPEQTCEWQGADEIELLRTVIRMIAPTGTPAAITVRKTLSFEQAEAIYSS